jgi:hypothetical protein
VDFTAENNLYCDSWIMAGKSLSSARNSWEILAQLQHYGIPTRLLDWTSSLINAIFFSASMCGACTTLSNCQDKKIGKQNKCSPALWVIHPEKMHEYFHDKHEIFKNNAVITIGIDEFPDYYEHFIKWDRSSWPYGTKPVFIEIPWLSERIQTQKGYFTFHPGKFDISKMPLKERNMFSRKINIDYFNINKLLDEIKVLGISEYDVYPDLTALGNHFKRTLGN